MGEWIKWESRKEEHCGKPAWARLSSDRTIPLPRLPRHYLATDTDITHYMPMEVPDPPKPEPVYECPFCGGQRIGTRIHDAHEGGPRAYEGMCMGCRWKGPGELTKAAAMAHFERKEE